MAKKKKKDYKCKLLPFERVDCLSVQDAKQKAGWNITAFDLPRTWKFSQGEGVVIAVLDTGCDLDHPDLKGTCCRARILSSAINHLKMTTDTSRM